MCAPISDGFQSRFTGCQIFSFIDGASAAPIKSVQLAHGLPMVLMSDALQFSRLV